jgi:tetratricopeptide (TPR) repeat protein
MKSNPVHGKELYQDATDNYKELLKVNPNSSDVWLRLGILQRQLGENDAAITSFGQAEKINPRNADAFLNHAMILEEEGKKQEAMDTYNKVLGIEPDNTLALNNLAFLNAEMGKNLDQALTFAQRAKQRVPDNPDISDTLGYVYYQRNLNTEALRIFRQLVQEQPQNATFRLHLAMALLKQGDKQGARDQAEKAMRNAQPNQVDEIRSFVNKIG